MVKFMLHIQKKVILMISVGNKKGFTLVELLSVIVLIGLLLGLAIPGIKKISSNMKKKSYNTKVKLVEQAAVLWGQDNKTRLNRNENCVDGKYSCYKIKIIDLIKDNYLDGDNNSIEFKNPIDNSDMSNSCVYVYKKNNRVYAKYKDNENFCGTSTEIVNVLNQVENITSRDQETLTFDKKEDIVYMYKIGEDNYEVMSNNQITIREDDNGEMISVKECMKGTEDCSEPITYKIIINFDTEKPSINLSGSQVIKIDSIESLNISSDYFSVSDNTTSEDILKSRIVTSEPTQYNNCGMYKFTAYVTDESDNKSDDINFYVIDKDNFMNSLTWTKISSDYESTPLTYNRITGLPSSYQYKYTIDSEFTLGCNFSFPLFCTGNSIDRMSCTNDISLNKQSNQFNYSYIISGTITGTIKPTKIKIGLTSSNPNASYYIICDADFQNCYLN